MRSQFRLSSMTLVHPTQAVELFGIFSPYDSLGTLLFWCQNRWWGTPLSLWNLRSKWPTPFQTAKFRPISAHSASTVIASERSSISTYRKSTTRFPTSHRWTVYVTPKSPKEWHKNAISLFVPVKFNFRKKSATKFLCMKTSSGKVVAIQRSIDRLRATSPSKWNWRSKWYTPSFRKHRFRQLSYNCSYAVTATTDTFCDRNLAQRI